MVEESLPRQPSLVLRWCSWPYAASGRGRNAATQRTALRRLSNVPTGAFSKKDAMVLPCNLPAIVELGSAAGFDFDLIDQGNLGHSALTQARNQLPGCIRSSWRVFPYAAG